LKIFNIYANVTLFSKWRQLGMKVMDLGALVQNDTEIPKDQIKQWMEGVTNTLNEFEQLSRDTLDYIKLPEETMRNIAFEGLKNELVELRDVLHGIQKDDEDLPY